MFQDIKVSNYNRTIEMYAIVDDRENNNLITSDYILKRIIKSFIHKLNDDDKQLAIKYFLQYFPYNSTLFQIIKEQDAPKSLIKKINYCNDYYGLKQNQKVYEQNEKLQLILFDEDYHKLIKLFDEKEFLENYQIPTLFRQHKHIIEKIKNHSFKLIDLIEQCYDQSFQLNSTILSHLVFFFYILRNYKQAVKNKWNYIYYQGKSYVNVACNLSIILNYCNSNNRIKIKSKLFLKFLNYYYHLIWRCQKFKCNRYFKYNNFVKRIGKILLIKKKQVINVAQQQIENCQIKMIKFLILKKLIFQFNNNFQSFLNFKLFFIRYVFIAWHISINIMKNICLPLIRLKGIKNLIYIYKKKANIICSNLIKCNLKVMNNIQMNKYQIMVNGKH